MRNDSVEQWCSNRHQSCCEIINSFDSLSNSYIAVVIIHVVDEICPFLRHVIVSVVHWFLR